MAKRKTVNDNNEVVVQHEGPTQDVIDATPEPEVLYKLYVDPLTATVALLAQVLNSVNVMANENTLQGLHPTIQRLFMRM